MMSAYDNQAPSLVMALARTPSADGLNMPRYDDLMRDATRRSLDDIGLDVWRYGILLYCDLMVLLRINWLNRRLRALMADPAFIVEYQSHCWYLMPRYCMCERNVFYLNLPAVLDFSYDYRGLEESSTTPPAKSLQDASLILRRFGRTPDMLCQSLERSGGSPPTREPLRVSRLDPGRSPLFTEGFTRMWIDNTIVPVPRMCHHPVEFRRAVHPGSFRPQRLETETLSQFEHRTFWRECHHVTDEMVACVQRGEDPRTVTPPGQLEHGFHAPEENLLQKWLDHCEAHGLDPYDPMVDDDDCTGFRSIRWARLKMFETAVGGSSYPLELCLHREDLVKSAHRLGVDYLDRLFVHVGRYRGADLDWNTMDHGGVLYCMGIRYENEPQDFVPWVISTQAMIHSVYAHMWLDALSQWSRMLQSHMYNLAMEIEDDMGFGSFRRRWTFLMSLCYAGPTMKPPEGSQTANQRRRDQAAIHIVCNNHYLEENRFLASVVDRDDQDRDGRYMARLVDQFVQPTPNSRTETQRVKDAYRSIRLAEYMTEFADTVGPRVDERTRVARRRAYEIYLTAMIPLLMFSPGWKRLYHWKPSRTHEETNWYIPRVNLQHNHRFQFYLNYCNRRTLYYHPDPSLLLGDMAQDATQGWRG